MTAGVEPEPDLERIEVDLLLEGIHRRYGLDFRGYATGSLKRRLWRRVEAEGLSSLSVLQERILRDPACLDRLVVDLSVNVTSMFRDPGFYRAFRDKAVPLLRTYPFIRLWNAGCSTGEETFSLAILLEEEGLLERSRIYATDVNAEVLDRARAGLFPLDRMRDYTHNYIEAGGRRAFSDYYVAEDSGVRFDPALTRNVVFAQHNLASDGSFNEFQAIVCRNVMIYFGRALQDRVHALFHDSLGRFGILALGRKEAIRFTAREHAYEELDREEKLFRRIA
jgi:chemotaxis protein methyltransferase CheR